MLLFWFCEHTSWIVVTWDQWRTTKRMTHPIQWFLLILLLVIVWNFDGPTNMVNFTSDFFQASCLILTPKELRLKTSIALIQWNEFFSQKITFALYELICWTLFIYDEEERKATTTTTTKIYKARIKVLFKNRASRSFSLSSRLLHLFGRPYLGIVMEIETIRLTLKRYRHFYHLLLKAMTKLKYVYYRN
jgi:hypothetical protein